MLRGKTKKTENLTFLQRLSLYFFARPRTTALIWIVVAVFGSLSYATLNKREGFPTVNTPFAQTSGAYLVNDPAKVDNDVAKPISDFLLRQDGIKSVQTQSFDNFYNAVVIYNDDVNADSRSTELQKAIIDQKLLPEQATIKVEAFKFGFTQRGDDMVVSFYSKNNNVPVEQLTEKAKKAAEYIKDQKLVLVQDASVIDPFEKAPNTQTGQEQSTQKTFDRYGEKVGEQTNFYSSVVIGINAIDKADNLELDKQIQEVVSKLNAQPEFKDFQAVVSASYAPDINAQISELQKTLLEGLLAVLIVGSIIIAIRASIITVVAMLTVIATVNALLYAIGYTLNTITLFSLVLGLSLIVDDTIIMTEAIDTQRKKHKDAKKAISLATKKIGRAMVAATLTAALSFAPFLFVGGILGEFIRAIPITIISAMLISLVVALVFIPLFARFLLLGKKQMGNENVHEVSAGIEERIARFIAKPMMWAKGSGKKLLSVGIVAVLIGFLFIGAGGYLFQKVTFNIFPPDKDSNLLNVILTYPPNTSIETAEATADRANKAMIETLGDNFVKASNYNLANTQSATLTVYLKDYKERESKSPELAKQLQEKLDGFDGAEVAVSQIGAGGPSGIFSARVDASKNREASTKMAQDIETFLKQTDLKRADGSIVKIKSVAIDNSSIFTRDEGKEYVGVGIQFEDTDTSALFALTQDAIKKEFSENKTETYGLNKDALSFDLGQEAENQDSFKTLGIAFPILLLVMYLLLAVQFRSLLQPVLIFMALPFSLFGITLGLYLSDNAFSFFSMLGFFALIGLSIKNTILLTDYANQARRAGMGPVDAAQEALIERFRPLVATSLTAAVSLIPLAITSPFWEGLAVVLICGLLSSTLLVLTVFPYYYLGSEYLRAHIGRKSALLWVASTIALIIILSISGFGPLSALAPIVTAVILFILKKKRLLVYS